MAFSTEAMDDSSLRIRERQQKTSAAMSGSTRQRSSSRRRRSGDKDEKRRAASTKEESSSEEDVNCSANPLRRWADGSLHKKEREREKEKPVSHRTSRIKSSSRRRKKSSSLTEDNSVKDHTRRPLHEEHEEDTGSEMDHSQRSDPGEPPAGDQTLDKAVKSTMRGDSVTMHQFRRGRGSGSGRHRGNNKIQQMRSKQKAALGSYYKDHAVEDIETLEIQRHEEEVRQQSVSNRNLRTHSTSNSKSNAPTLNISINAHKEALLSLKLEHEDELAENRIKAKNQSEQPLSREMSLRVEEMKRNASISRMRSSSVPPELDISAHKQALASLQTEHKEGIPTDQPAKKKKNPKKPSSTRPTSTSCTRKEEKSSRGRSSSRAPITSFPKDGGVKEAEDTKSNNKPRKPRATSTPPDLQASIHKDKQQESGVTKKKKDKTLKKNKSTDKDTTSKRTRSKSKSRRSSRKSQADNSKSTKAQNREESWSTHETLSTANARQREEMMQQHSQANKSWSTLASLPDHLDEPQPTTTTTTRRAQDVRRSKSSGTHETMPIHLDDVSIERRHKHAKSVRFAEGVTAYQLEPLKQDPSTIWYSQQDLSMLLDHEMKIAVRALEEIETSDLDDRRTKQKALHCCWRGLEHIQRRQDKAEHITRHILSVLVIHYDLQKQVKEGREFSKSPSELLRAQSKSLTRDDRKLAYKYGLQDAKEARSSPNDRLETIMEIVSKEHGRHCKRRSDSRSRRKDPKGGNIIERSVRGVRNTLMHQSLQDLRYSEDPAAKFRHSSGSKSERSSRSTAVEPVSMLRHPMENTQLIIGAVKNS